MANTVEGLILGGFSTIAVGAPGQSTTRTTTTTTGAVSGDVSFGSDETDTATITNSLGIIV